MAVRKALGDGGRTPQVLRTVLSLSRLWQQQGKRDAAYEILADIYGWFTEGFDTPDLQDARALLEALSDTSILWG
jgi:hypothetical protein